MAGGLAGGYMVYHFTSSFFLDSYYTSEAAKATINITALSHLRKGQVDSAINIIEMDMDASALALDAAVRESSVKKEKVEKILMGIKEYQIRYGRGH